MRRHLAFFLFLSSAVLPLACASLSDRATDDSETAEEGLAPRGIEPKDPPVRPRRDAGPRPPITAPIGTLVVDPGPANVPYCGTTRFDLRRVTRTCEDLPGAYVEGGVTYIPGNGGRFGVARLLASAPEAIASKTCAFTWESASCAQPDVDKLLVEEPHEQLAPRMPGCQYWSGGCDMKMPVPKVDGGIPTGLGRCEVCGFASDTHLYAVLPPYWTSFSYWAGGQRYTAQVPTPQDTVQLDLGAAVPDQDVTLYKNNGAPQTP